MRHAALALLAALVLGACGGDGDDDASVPPPTTTKAASTPVRIGTKDFTEQYILGELYRQALEAKGFDVELRDNIGSSELTHEALTGKSLDMYPEYVGVLLSEVAKITDRPRDAAAAYKRAKEWEERSGYTLLEPTPFTNANALAVKPAFARAHRLRSITDLRRLKRDVRLAAPPEFRTRYEGLVGLKDRYRLSGVRFMPTERRYPVIDAGRVDAALVYETEGQLASRMYVLLDDPRDLFATQHVAPIISKAIVKTYGPRLTDAINAVSATLTTAAMRKMNAAVVMDKRQPAEVAGEFLRAKGLSR